MINLNPSISSTGSITLPKVNAAVTQKQNEASTSSSASSFGPAARVDISEQATRMKPARFSVSADRKYDVLAEVRKSVAARTGTADETAKTGDTAKADEKTTAAKSSKPARFAVDPSKKYDVLEEVKKSVAAREAAANEAAKKAAAAE